MPATTPTQAASTAESHIPSNLCTTTRVLLTLWDLGAGEAAVKKSDVLQRLVRKGQKSADYQPLFDQLAQQQAILVEKNKFFLAPHGIELLGKGLQDPEFTFDSQIGAKTANALLRWMRQNLATISGAAANVKTKAAVITSYVEFKHVALEVYDRLNRDYNMGNLVPIYRIRREIGDRINRSDFNQWLLKLQSDDIVQLQGGSVEDSALDKIEDSITTEISGLRCYVKRLK